MHPQPNGQPPLTTAAHSNHSQVLSRHCPSPLSYKHATKGMCLYLQRKPPNADRSKQRRAPTVRCALRERRPEGPSNPHSPIFLACVVSPAHKTLSLDPEDSHAFLSSCGWLLLCSSFIEENLELEPAAQTGGLIEGGSTIQEDQNPFSVDCGLLLCRQD